MMPIYPWIFNNLSLNHLATVETVSVLYKESGVLDGIKESIYNILPGCNFSNYSPTSIIHPMVTRFDTYLDTLELPTTLKNDLSVYLWQMLQQGLNTKEIRRWVGDGVADSNKAEEVSEMMSVYLRDIIWDSIGRLNRKRMLELSVSRSKTIDYACWAILCEYCCEDEIRKFADTVDWKKCNFTPMTIFWYYTIYGTFPAENMFESSSNYAEFKRHCHLRLYHRNTIYGSLLMYTIKCGNYWAAKFVCDRLPVSKKFELISTAMEKILTKASADVAVYLVSQVNFNYSSVVPVTFRKHLWFLFDWPYVLFIDSWFDQLKTVDVKDFDAIFGVLAVLRKTEQVGRVEKFTGRQVSNYLHVKYYVPCEKLWTLYCNNFGRSDWSACRIATVMLYSQDIKLCKILMKGSTCIWRHKWLHFLNKYSNGLEFMENQEFCDKFVEDILIYDWERERFLSIRSGAVIADS